MRDQKLASCALAGPTWEHITDFSTTIADDFLVTKVEDLKQLLGRGPGIATALQMKTSLSKSGWWHQSTQLPKKLGDADLARFYRDDIDPTLPFMKYFFVDMKGDCHDLLFTTSLRQRISGILKRAVGMTFIATTARCASISHVDKQDAIAIVLEGVKIFRVKVGEGPLVPKDGIMKLRETVCPSGWLDIVMTPGQAIFVPKGSRHAVWSACKSLLLSINLSDPECDNSPNDMDVSPLQSPHALPPSLYAEAPVTDTSVDYDDESGKAANQRRNAEFRACLNSGPKSTLSQITNEWSCEGIPGVLVLEPTDKMSSAIGALRNAMFDESMLLRPDVVEQSGWGELFGQKIPNVSTKSTESARAILPFKKLVELVPSLSDVVDVALRAVTEAVSERLLGVRSDLEITLTTSAVLVRLVGRIPAQRMHIDGGSENFSTGTELSCIVAMTPQRGVVFIDLKGTIDGNNICPFVSPRLNVGSVAAFGVSTSTHFGQSVSGVSTGEVMSAVAFLTFNVTAPNESPVRSLSGRVDVSPDEFVLSGISCPAVLKCVACEHPIFNTDMLQLRYCKSCCVVHTAAYMARFGSLPGTVCSVCVKYPVDPTPLVQLQQTSQKRKSDLVFKFMMKSLVCDCRQAGTVEVHSRLCGHHHEEFEPFPENRQVLLYFGMAELRRTALWMMAVHLNNSPRGQDMLPQLAPQGEGLEGLLVYVGGGCPRKRALLTLILEFCSVRHLCSSTFSRETMFAADTAGPDFIVSVLSRLTLLVDLLGNSYEAALDLLNRYFVFGLLQQEALDLQCTCDDGPKFPKFVRCNPDVTLLTTAVCAEGAYSNMIVNFKKRVSQTTPGVMEELREFGICF